MGSMALNSAKSFVVNVVIPTTSMGIKIVTFRAYLDALKKKMIWCKNMA